MRILAVHSEPLHQIAFENVTPGRTVVIEQLDLLTAMADQLPDAIDAIVMTADLQGRESRRRGQTPGRLLGEVLAEELEILSGLDQLPPLSRLGVVLAGDFYTKPEMDKRGGSGDVRGVWEAFARRCRWVVGVAGNHDFFGPGWSEPDLKAFKKQPNIHLLDGDTAELDGLRFAGLSGTVGNPRRPWRRLEDDYAEWVGLLASHGPDVLILHDGPDGPGPGFLGRSSARQALEATRPTLVVRGHAYWHEPLVTLANGGQVLNVDSRVVVLRRD